MRWLYYLPRLMGLAITLRRHGAIRALGSIRLFPRMAVWLLRGFSFWVPHRRDLPEEDGLRLAAALTAMGPSYIKIGQTLATRPDLIGVDMARALMRLQDRLAPFATDAAESRVAATLGAPVEALFTSFDPVPVAAASMAQVHKAVTRDGRQVAVKILRPDIRKRFDRDLALFRWLAGVAEKRSREARRLRLTATVDKLASTVALEMDLRREAAAASKLAQQCASEKGYRIPAVDWVRTGESVLTLEWVDGVPLGDSDALDAGKHDRAALANRLVQVFLRQALVDGFFHADLHHGNLIVEADGTIVALDFGIMGQLSRDERRYFADILTGFLRRDYDWVAEVHFEAGYVPQHADKDEFALALRAIADPILGLTASEISAARLLDQLFLTTARFEMQTQPQLLLLQRSMMMVEGLALHLDARVNMWDAARPVLEGSMRQLLSPPARLWSRAGRFLAAVDRLPKVIDRLSEMPTPQVQRSPVAVPVWLSLSLGVLLGMILSDPPAIILTAIDVIGSWFER